ncbi:MAG: phytanoyl-CoA dioxygenase family protein [Vicingaceae bacterium]|nr:phytanoyl-CoA dioxygenase family protein [Vicingaceae bacterium]
MNRERIAKRQANKIGKTEFSGASILEKLPNLDEVNNLGYTKLGVLLNNEKVEKLVNELNKLECFDPYRSELKRFKVSEVSPLTQVANYKREDLVGIKEVVEIANDPKVLAFAQEFLGSIPTISNINAWWSFGEKEAAEQAQFFHRDVDDYKFIKLFFYLTDVEMENGPHVYVESSSKDDQFTKIRRFSDAEIEETYGKDKIKYFTGKKGEAFFVDTYGIHKGLLPKKGKRLILQVQYSINEVGVESYIPQKIEGNYNKYVNRLLIK